MVQVEFALLYLGLGGLAVGAVIGLVVRRRRHRWAAVTAAGVLGAVVWVAFWVWWGSQPCGESCIRDPTAILAVLPFQLLTYGVGATAVVRLAGR